MPLYLVLMIFCAASCFNGSPLPVFGSFDMPMDATPQSRTAARYVAVNTHAIVVYGESVPAIPLLSEDLTISSADWPAPKLTPAATRGAPARHRRSAGRCGGIYQGCPAPSMTQGDSGRCACS